MMKKSQICQLLPHSGTMCLLDEVVSWDAISLVAKTMSHTEDDNPLIVNGSLNSIHGVEYSAQAMASHSVLLKQQEAETKSGQYQSRGYLAGVKKIQISEQYLFDAQPENLMPLLIHVSVMLSGSQGFTYQFKILKNDKNFISGIVTIFLL